MIKTLSLVQLMKLTIERRAVSPPAPAQRLITYHILNNFTD